MKRFQLFFIVILFITSSNCLLAQQWTLLVLNQDGSIIRGAKLLGPLGEEYPVNEKGEAIYAKPWAPDVTVKAAGYRAQKVSLARSPENSTVTVRMIALPPEYEPLNVYVYDKLTKKPVANAFVSVFSGQSGHTNQSGFARAGHRQTPGDYIDFMVQADDYKIYRGSVLNGETQRLQGSIMQRGQRATVYLEKGTNQYNVNAIIVEVLDDENDNPVSNASVIMTLSDKTEYKGTTNGKGETRFSDNELGFQGTNARVKVKHPDYEEKWSDITEELMNSTNPEDRRFLVMMKKIQSSSWNGSFKDNYSVYNFSGGNGTVTGSFLYAVSDAKGNGNLQSTKVEGNTAVGTWTCQHDDITKSGTRKGTFKLTLIGNTVSGELTEGAPQWNYKAGYSAANVQSSMYKGKTWNVSFTRK